MEEIDEVNAGNAIIVGLGTDGIYHVDVEAGENLTAAFGKSVEGLLKNVSGRGLHWGRGRNRRRRV